MLPKPCQNIDSQASAHLNVKIAKFSSSVSDEALIPDSRKIATSCICPAPALGVSKEGKTVCCWFVHCKNIQNISTRYKDFVREVW